MEKLDKVIAGLGACVMGLCQSCPYGEYGTPRCRTEVMVDAYNLVQRLCLKLERVEAERDDLRKDVAVLSEDLTGAQNEIHALLKKQDILRAELAEERERSARWLRESEPVVHAHWIRVGWGYYKCSHCEAEIGSYSGHKSYCANCGAKMDEQLELRTCYCPICDKHFQVRSNDSGGSCPDCGHHVVLHGKEVADG